MSPLHSLYYLLGQKPRKLTDRSSILLGKKTPRQTNLGVSDVQVQGGPPQRIQQPTHPLQVLPQGGVYNPGAIPLQGSNIRYRQGLQPTQPWYDF